MTTSVAEMLVLEQWRGTWSADDADANFKADVALYSGLDPLHTLRGLSKAVGIPIGALARYVLARYATTGSAGLLEIGPQMVNRLWEPIVAAEHEGSDRARLAAYEELRKLISWLGVPLREDGGYLSNSADEHSECK